MGCTRRCWTRNISNSTGWTWQVYCFNSTWQFFFKKILLESRNKTAPKSAELSNKTKKRKRAPNSAKEGQEALKSTKALSRALKSAKTRPKMQIGASASRWQGSYLALQRIRLGILKKGWLRLKPNGEWNEKENTFSCSSQLTWKGEAKRDTIDVT